MYSEMLTASFKVLLVNSGVADILEPQCFCWKVSGGLSRINKVCREVYSVQEKVQLSVCMFGVFEPLICE